MAAPFIAGGLVGREASSTCRGRGPSPCVLCAVAAGIGAWLYINTASQVDVPAPEMRWMGVDRGLRRARVLVGRAFTRAMGLAASPLS